MHTRRVGAFLIGAWLLGAALMAFISSQAFVNVERFLSNPPDQISKELDDIGPDMMRQILRYQASPTHQTYHRNLGSHATRTRRSPSSDIPFLRLTGAASLSAHR